LSGTIEHPNTDLFATIGSVLHNAFVAAFARSIEGSISVRSLRQSLRDDDNDKGKKPDDKKKRKV
jgi:hypothetical protein